MRAQYMMYKVLLISITMGFFACDRNEIQAEDSLIGEWDVVNIHSQYGEFFQGDFGFGFDPSESVSDSGQLGTFIFIKDVVDYYFTRNDTLFSGSESWNLELARVREGFSRVNEFTLTINDRFFFDVSFGDDTRNSERDANKVTFLETPTTSGPGVIIEILLEKR